MLLMSRFRSLPGAANSRRRISPKPIRCLSDGASVLIRDNSLDFNILYTDEHLVAIDKPSGGPMQGLQAAGGGPLAALYRDPQADHRQNSRLGRVQQEATEKA